MTLTDEDCSLCQDLWTHHASPEEIYLAGKRAGMEAAAKVCEALPKSWHECREGTSWDLADADDCAAAIRVLLE